MKTTFSLALLPAMMLALAAFSTHAAPAPKNSADSKEPLKATAPDFHVKKPGLVFRMGGKDGQEVAFDNVKVWALK